MSPIPKWLQEYYGQDIDLLNPSVVKEGKTYAIVKIQKTDRVPGSYSKVGYVLLRMTGRHIATPHVSLHEGTPTDADLSRMYATLLEYDENG